MANQIYPLYKRAAMQSLAGNLLTDVVKLALIDTGAYAYNATHEFMSSIAPAAVIARSPALTSKLLTGPAFDSADVVLPAVNGAQSEALVIFIDTGNDATSRLVSYQDSGATGLPVTPNGADITITVDPAGWFAL